MADPEIPRSSAPIRTIAVIGAGKMGAPIARHLLQAGFGLTVCDQNIACLEEFAAMGVRTTTTPSDCMDCEVAIVLVATSDQLRAVTLGEDGLTPARQGGKLRYLVVMSTISPRQIRELEAAYAGGLVQLVDAPISGGIVAAKKGALTILAGGEANDVAALRPVFEAFGKNVFHCGPLGAGQTTKIVNNIIAISNTMIAAEAYRAALANGLTLEGIIPALEAGSGRNFMSRDAMDAPDFYATASESEEYYRAFLVINRKDIDLALSLGSGQFEMPGVRAIRDLIDNAGEETFSTWRLISGLAGASDVPPAPGS